MLEIENRTKLQERLGRDFLLFDGGMGTQLQAGGMRAGQIPEELNIDDPEMIVTIHCNYLNAGADFITTNTFGCNRLKMAQAKYSVREMIQAAIANAKEAQKRCGREHDSYIVLDIGPIGTMLKPLGTLSFDMAYEIIREEILFAGDGADAVLLETMTDLYEVKAGILAAKENTTLPVFTTMTFEKSGRTMTGVDAESFVNVVEGLGVSMLGVNCSLGPKELAPVIETILRNAHLPVMVQPNAGLPSLKNGETVYELTAVQFVTQMLPYINDGLSVCGGCCGTTPEFIRTLHRERPVQVIPRNNPYRTRVSSPNRTVTFDGHVIVCGERLNPTGKKKLQAALREHRFEELVAEAIRQEDAGAEVLDLNVGLPGIDETETMKTVIPMLQEVVDLPLQLDSSSAEALEAACRYYNGKPLINSVNGKPETMKAIFPIVQKYGGVVIGLTLKEEIPHKAEERFTIAEEIIAEAQKYNIRKEDVIIDCLTLTASAQQEDAAETLRAIAMMRENGSRTVLGVSNISFGLPYRALLNRTFLAMAIDAGLDLPIMNPLDAEMMGCVDAANLLLNYDQDCTSYVEKYANYVPLTGVIGTANQAAGDSAVQGGAQKAFTLSDLICKGMKAEIAAQTELELKSKAPMELVNEVVIPALNQVGRDYESGVIFLPQLIQAAESSKLAFDVIKSHFAANDEKKGPVVLCTVEGDIHDIGKNIVRVILESYGYEVIDLGKDVKPETVLAAVTEHRPKAVGLSALMTTTVVNMQKTIEVLHAHDCPCPIWVGGAVLTAQIAEEIGADYYTEDAMESVRLLDRIIQ